MTTSISQSKKSNIDSVLQNDKIIWSIIDRYFKDNKNILIKHHIDSFNQFFDNNIKNIFTCDNSLSCHLLSTKNALATLTYCLNTTEFNSDCTKGAILYFLAKAKSLSS